MSNNQQLEMFDYWEPQEDPTERDSDPRSKTPLEMVKEYQKVSGQKPDPALYAYLIQEEYDEWYEVEHCAPLNAEGAEAVLKELADLVYVVYGYANSYGWDLDMALLRVHESNMSRMIQDDGTIKRRDDGKIIKNPNSPKVDLKDLV